MGINEYAIYFSKSPYSNNAINIMTEIIIKIRSNSFFSFCFYFGFEGSFWKKLEPSGRLVGGVGKLFFNSDCNFSIRFSIALKSSVQ